MKVWTDDGVSAWSAWSPGKLVCSTSRIGRQGGSRRASRTGRGASARLPLPNEFVSCRAVRAGCTPRPRALRAVPERRTRRRRELTPGSTAYGSHLEVQTYNVTDQLVPGANGSPCGRRRVVPRAGPATPVRWTATGPGSRCSFSSRPISTTAPGRPSAPVRAGAARVHVVAADLIAGQREDLAPAAGRLDRPGFDDAGGPTPRSSRRTSRPGRLARAAGAPGRGAAPGRVRRLAPGRQVVDLGQNINGWVRLARPRPGRHRDHADARRGARRRAATSRPDHLQPASTS